MSKIYYGKKTKHCGKRAFEILCRLKNFGIGRVLQRNMFKEEWPDEPTYYKVVECEPQMDSDLAHGRLWVREVHRGKMYPTLREIWPWHPDYDLVPKHEEPDFSKFPILGQDKSLQTVLPATCQVPPLMAEYMHRKRLGLFPNLYLQGLDVQKHGYDAESLKTFTIPRRYKLQQEDPEEFDYNYRIAGPGEEPTVPMERIIVDKFNTGIQPI